MRILVKEIIEFECRVITNNILYSPFAIVFFLFSGKINEEYFEIKFNYTHLPYSDVTIQKNVFFLNNS